MKKCVVVSEKKYSSPKKIREKLSPFIAIRTSLESSFTLGKTPKKINKPQSTMGIIHLLTRKKTEFN